MRFLVIDDDVVDLVSLERLLNREFPGSVVDLFQLPADALKNGLENYSLIIVDRVLPGSHDGEYQSVLAAIAPCPVVCWTGGTATGEDVFHKDNPGELIQYIHHNCEPVGGTIKPLGIARKGEPRMVDRVLIFRSGFLQGRGSGGNGIIGMFQEALRRYSAPDQWVHLELWNDDPAGTAELIYRLTGGQRRSTPPRVMFVGYSWGCGYGFPNMARELRNRGITIEKAVLIDPVYYRFGFWWRAMIPETFLQRFTIPVDSEVKKLVWFRQETNSPRSHDLEITGKTKVSGPVTLATTHQEIDNHPVVFSRVIAEADEFFEYDDSPDPGGTAGE